MNWKTNYRSFYYEGAAEPSDQCISSTVRSLADESFNVILVEDCCAAGTDELHQKELEILNMIYCHVISSGELLELMGFEE